MVSVMRSFWFSPVCRLVVPVLVGIQSKLIVVFCPASRLLTVVWPLSMLFSQR